MSALLNIPYFGLIRIKSGLEIVDELVRISVRLDVPLIRAEELQPFVHFFRVQRSLAGFALVRAGIVQRLDQ